MVSVIITTYNREMSVLCRAIDSVLSQTYKNIELIIVNDYPNNRDLINQTLLNYDKDICVVHNLENKGACYSRNVGIKASNGKFIALLDDDDEWYKDKIEKQVRVISKNDNIALVYCNATVMKGNQNLGATNYVKKCDQNQLEELLKINYIGGCSFPLIRKSAIEKVGYFDEKLLSSQDYDLYIRLLKKFKAEYIDEELVKYYISDDAITRSLNKRLQGYITLTKKYKKEFRMYPKSAVCFYNNIIGMFVENKLYFKAIIQFFKSFLYFPYNLKIINIWFNIAMKKIKKIERS